MNPLIPQVLVSLVALGMGLAFISADRDSPTSRALSLALGLIGIAIFLNGAVLPRSGPIGYVAGLVVVPESAAIVLVLEWLLRVRRTVPAGALDTKGGDWMLRLGQASGLLYGLVSIVAPDLRATEFLYAVNNLAALERPGFWLFAGPILFSTATGGLSTILLLRRRPDRPERIRVLALVAAVPFLSAGLILRQEVSAVSVVIGEMIMLIGAVQYHVLQGQRGQFMSRFLSSAVAALVRDRGMKSAMEQNYLEITVVVSDLRGFTAYAQAHPSSRVIQVLQDYYDAVGAVVAEYGATIKDYAGDGILILVGAPIPMADHAEVALAIADRVRSATQAVTRRWSSGRHRLGIGVGVASGFVTVGVIGSASRLEYTAVGPAVNLASRLCELAADGEILVDARTRELVAGAVVESRTAQSIKGFPEPISVWALPAT